ncbi:MAG: hypothetical protein CO171_03465 [Syntrophobacterales bacterium CG_4_9_14_3_um_filter_49_8]|nr:MAG: hypothetical protein CO171_03465 [Syntrophobacterales bacterium CG_4_9_14_3_um_filter_49_8]
MEGVITSMPGGKSPGRSVSRDDGDRVSMTSSITWGEKAYGITRRGPPASEATSTAARRALSSVQRQIVARLFSEDSRR